MADEAFDQAYTSNHFQYPVIQNMSNMQRFEQQEGPYIAMRPVYDQGQPSFMEKNSSPLASVAYGTPTPWLHNVTTIHDQCPQESWSGSWASPDLESCPGAARTPWSPHTTESCSDHDPQYPAFPSPVYTSGYGYTGYGSGMAHGPVPSSSQSFTGSLSEIQGYRDTDHENSPLQEETKSLDRCYPSLAPHLHAGDHNDEGLGSSINDSAMASPNSIDDDETTPADNAEDSDYAPTSKNSRSSHKSKPRNPKQSRTKTAQSQSPTSKRSSSNKEIPHQLTRPAQIAKRTSTAPNPRPATRIVPVTPQPSQPAQQHSQQQHHHPSRSGDHICQHCFTTFASSSTLSKHILSNHTRPFTCTFRLYGCTSTFGSKNEWKRHVLSQHLCPEIWRCNLGACVPRPSPSPNGKNGKGKGGKDAVVVYNDFNRKDLFTSHLRRMHKPSASASRAEKEKWNKSCEDLARKCWMKVRDLPARSGCGFCIAAAGASPTSTTNRLSVTSPTMTTNPLQQTPKATLPIFECWDERMEHVGRHLEKMDPGPEAEDLELRDWMIKEGVL
ncbi:MAG: hypothetical protein Q9183_003842, partial [Haloplaca sp. 2 TL-2023]